MMRTAKDIAICRTCQAVADLLGIDVHAIRGCKTVVLIYLAIDQIMKTDHCTYQSDDPNARWASQWYGVADDFILLADILRPEYQ